MLSLYAGDLAIYMLSENFGGGQHTPKRTSQFPRMIRQVAGPDAALCTAFLQAIRGGQYRERR